MKDFFWLPKLSLMDFCLSAPLPLRSPFAVCVSLTSSLLLFSAAGTSSRSSAAWRPMVDERSRVTLWMLVTSLKAAADAKSLILGDTSRALVVAAALFATVRSDASEGEFLSTRLLTAVTFWLAGTLCSTPAAEIKNTLFLIQSLSTTELMFCILIQTSELGLCNQLFKAVLVLFNILPLFCLNCHHVSIPRKDDSIENTRIIF